MAARLSHSDVEMLAREMSPASRATVAGKIGPLLDDDLSASEREIAEAVARRLAQDVVVLVRHALAMSVRNSRLLPKDIAYRLAFDVEEVAGPFLEVTDVFGEQELARIAKAVHPRHTYGPSRAGRPYPGLWLVNSLTEEICRSCRF